MNDQPSESNQPKRTVYVHASARDLDSRPAPRDQARRRADRARGLDLLGRPTARSLGIQPRKLMRDDPTLTLPQALKLSRQLLEERWKQLGTE